MTRPKRLFTLPTAQPKTGKGLAHGWATLVLHLAPHNLGTPNAKATVCSDAVQACIDVCINTTGRGGINAGTLDDIRARRTNGIQLARIRRTEAFFADADAFVARMAREIRNFVRWADTRGQRAAVRLNGTSDIAWEKVAPELFALFPDVVFYDYTKAPVTKRPWLPVNYSLTMSYSGENWDACRAALDHGRNVAVVFAVKKGAALPSHHHGYAVVDGDETDLRFLDPRGVIVGLRAKGRARNTTSTFIVAPQVPQLAPLARTA